MELVAVLRALWRFRLLVVVGCVVAGGLGYMATQGVTTYQGTASTRVMLDTPTSQTLEANSVLRPVARVARRPRRRPDGDRRHARPRRPRDGHPV